MTPADVGSDRSHFLRLRAVAAHCRAGGLPYPVVSVPEGVVMTPDLLYLADEGREEDLGGGAGPMEDPIPRGVRLSGFPSLTGCHRVLLRRA